MIGARTARSNLHSASAGDPADPLRALLDEGWSDAETDCDHHIPVHLACIGG